MLSKQSDVINKKAIIILPVSGGIGAYAIKFLFDFMHDILDYYFYYKRKRRFYQLHKIEMKMEDLENV